MSVEEFSKLLKGKVSLFGLLIFDLSTFFPQASYQIFFSKLNRPKQSRLNKQFSAQSLKENFLGVS